MHALDQGKIGTSVLSSNGILKNTLDMPTLLLFINRRTLISHYTKPEIKSYQQL